MNLLRRFLSRRRPKRWCIFTSAGERNNIAQWFSGGGPRHWDLVTAFYGEDDDSFAGLAARSAHIFRRKGSKFQNLKALVSQQPGFFERYSHVWVCDDDIRMNAADIERVFTIAEANGFWVAQPAFSASGKNSHRITVSHAQDAGDYRLVNFVELGVALFRRDKLMEFLAAYDGSLAGYGIDYWYANLLDANQPGRFAIIDRVRVTNPTDDEKGGCEIDRLQPWAERKADWEALRDRLGLVEFPYREFERSRRA